jgi:hypothetical protein
MLSNCLLNELTLYFFVEMFLELFANICFGYLSVFSESTLGMQVYHARVTGEQKYTGKKLTHGKESYESKCSAKRKAYLRRGGEKGVRLPSTRRQ